MQRQTSLSHHIIQFCRHLRQHGFSLGPQEEVDALHALEHIPWKDNYRFREALRAMLVKSRGQLVAFDDLYSQYWKELDRAVDSKVKDGAPEESPQSSSKPKPPSLEVLKDWLYGNKERETKEVASYSTGQTHDRADLSVFSKEESAELLRILRLITQALANRPHRRVQPQRKPGNLHLRQTMRESLRKGGDYVDLWYAHPKPRTVNIVLVCDVSKSMEIYSRFIIQLLWGFQSSHRQLETFVFSTQLARVTRHLKGRRLRDALQRLTDYVDDWSAGTRIGASLHTLATEYTRLLNSKTVVIVMSDGWDTGEMDLLEEAMKAIHKRAGKVIWINPLAKDVNEVPEVAGLKTAWPYIDLYAPAHDVEGLHGVVTKLRRSR